MRGLLTPRAQVARLNRLLELIQGVFNRQVVPLHRSARSGEVRHASADIRKAERMIGFVPAVSLEEGLRRTLSGYRDQALK